MNDGLEELVSHYLELRDAGSAPTPEAFADAHPRVREELLSALTATLGVLDAMRDSAPTAPTRIGEYRLLREVGRGGMGVVYEAQHGASADRYALKLLPPFLLAGSRAAERFRREARALTRLSHPGIVRLRDAGSHNGAPYLVMDLVPGEPLSRRVGSVSIAESVSLVRQLALACQAAHEAGIVHRDLKPQNVVVRPDGSPVLLDFGLTSTGNDPTLTATGETLGTPRYMAPEQVRGEVATERTDVYGLGLILYELVTGRAAFDQDSREEVLRAVEKGLYDRPRDLRGDLPARMERILFHALALAPQNRYASAKELALDLERYQTGRSVLAPRSPLSRRARGWILATSALAAVVLIIGLLMSGRDRAALERALLLARTGREHEALTALRTMSTRAPDSLPLLGELATLELTHGEPARGLLTVRHALELSSDDPDLLRIEAGLLNRLERRDEARALYLALLDRNPADRETRFGLALSFDEDHRAEEAERQYREVLEVEPDHVRALTNLSWLLSGALVGSCEQCDDVYAAAPRLLDPARAQAYLLRAIDCGAAENKRLRTTLVSLAVRMPDLAFVVDSVQRMAEETGDTDGASATALRSLVTELRIRVPERGKSSSDGPPR
jgi:serine/threonine protein kinase